MFARDDENMRRRLRTNIFKREDVVILVHDLGRNLLRRDFAEQAFRAHGFPLQLTSLYPREKSKASHPRVHATARPASWRHPRRKPCPHERDNTNRWPTQTTGSPPENTRTS